jgi:hypothetical protein
VSVGRGGLRWVVPFVLVWVIGACWALATPRYGGPDEPAHVRKAAGTVRLQGIGDAVADGPDWLRSFDVPGGYVEPAPNCFAFQPDVPADCQVLPPLPDEDVAAASSAARYPPLSYAVVGLPSLVVGGYDGIYLMRLVQVTVVAAAFALAAWLLGRSGIGRWGWIGLLVAASPMVGFLAGVVNPNTVEIALMAPVWAALVVTVGRDGVLGRAEAWTVGGVGAAAVLTRQLSAMWLLLGAVVLVVVGGRAAVRTLLTSRRGRWIVGALVAAGLAQVAWLAAAGSLGSVADPRVATDDPPVTVVRTVIGQVSSNVTEMIGVFGWLDTPPPYVTVVAWVALWAGLGAAVLWAAPRRWALGVAAGVALVLVVPALLEIKDAPVTGYYWQGRYTLPLAVLVPVLGAVAVGRGASGRLPGRVALAVGVAVVAGQVAAFYTALRRNSVGIEGSLLLRGGWSPPLPPWVLVVGCAAAWVALVVVALRPTGDQVK